MSAHLDRRRPGQHHLADLFGTVDAADADDRDFDGLIDLPDHAQGHGEDRGAGKAAGGVGEQGLFRIQIDPHTEQGVDEGNAVCPCVLAGAGDLGNVGDIGGELHDDGLFCDSPDSPGDLGRGLRVGAEAHAAGAHIGTADVHLEPAHLLLLSKLFGRLGVFKRRAGGDICHHGLVKNFTKTGQFVADDRVDPGVLQADCVQHAGGALRNAREGIARARLRGRALEGEAAEKVDIVDAGKLQAVAEGSRGGQNGIVQFDAAELHVQASHSSSSFRKTGPSLQTRFIPLTVGLLQPMQAPKPQPIRTSKASSPGAWVASHTARSIPSRPQA